MKRKEEALGEMKGIDGVIYKQLMSQHLNCPKCKGTGFIWVGKNTVKRCECLEKLIEFQQNHGG